MRVWHWPGTEGPAPERTVATVGVFDGVHLGHQRILREVLEEARARNATPAVVTFDRHPHRTLGLPHQPFIMSLEHRLRVFESLGVTVCLVVRFTPEVAAMEAPEFARRVMRDVLRVRLLIVGPDWRFGREGRGDVALCRRMEPELGMAVRQVPPVTVGDVVVSSTAIRRAVAGADFTLAASLLGRPFSVLGTVVRGAGRGRRLGYPTANLNVHNELLPPDGVYAGWALVGDRWFGCVSSVGRQPTFADGGERCWQLEAHLLEAQPELYGQQMEVEFLQRLRGQRRFPSAGALARQIERDVERARQLLRARGQAHG